METAHKFCCACLDGPVEFFWKASVQVMGMVEGVLQVVMCLLQATGG